MPLWAGIWFLGEMLGREKQVRRALKYLQEDRSDLHLVVIPLQTLIFLCEVQ